MQQGIHVCYFSVEIRQRKTPHKTKHMVPSATPGIHQAPPGSCITTVYLIFLVFPSLSIFVFPFYGFPFSASIWLYVIFLFHSFSLTWTISLSEPLALSRKTSYPSPDRPGEEKRGNWRIVCQCYFFFFLLGKWNSFSFRRKAGAILVLMRNLYWLQMGPRRKNTGENLRRVSLCSRILTPYCWVQAQVGISPKVAKLFLSFL